MCTDNILLQALVPFWSLNNPQDVLNLAKKTSNLMLAAIWLPWLVGYDCTHQKQPVARWGTKYIVYFQLFHFFHRLIKRFFEFLFSISILLHFLNVCEIVWQNIPYSTASPSVGFLSKCATCIIAHKNWNTLPFSELDSHPCPVCSILSQLFSFIPERTAPRGCSPTGRLPLKRQKPHEQFETVRAAIDCEAFK